MVALDPVGNVSLMLQVVILFLLILGLPFAKSHGGKRNLMLHGYLTLLALALHTALIFIVMVPSFSSGFGEIAALSPVNAFTVWSHVILGAAAEILAIAVVTVWLVKSPSKMACWSMKRLMLPLFIIWAISLVNGALVHILGML